MTTAEFIQSITATAVPGDGTVDMKLEVVRIPVSDAERAKAFYQSLGWRVDADFHFDEATRGIQITPTGSDASIHLDIGASGSVTLFLAVSDIEAARQDLVDRGVAVSEVFHREGDDAQAPGPDADRNSYNSYAAFTDPDGNTWLLQEVTDRLPGRIQGKTAFGSANDLVDALRRAETAHGEYEKTLGHRHDDWAPWYAEYIVSEQSGAELPA
jgi:catechol 2,3-dioxygenase-like lactoylglutathione lyase family enzyme